MRQRTDAAPAAAVAVALVRPDTAALLGWTIAGGAVHAVWLWQRLRTLTAGDIPERIDGPIVVALSFLLWFCVPPLLVLLMQRGGT